MRPSSLWSRLVVVWLAVGLLCVDTLHDIVSTWFVWILLVALGLWQTAALLLIDHYENKRDIYQ